MAFLFGGNKRQKQPADIAKSLKELLQKLWETPANPKVEDEVAKHMSQMKLLVQGTPEIECSPAQVHELVDTIISQDILFELARSIRLLPFEARKDAQIIFSHILRFKPNNSSAPSAISYLVLQRPEIIVELCHGYNYPKIALTCGTILRQALQHDSITALVLYDESKEGDKAVDLKTVNVNVKQSGEGLFWNFFNWIDQESFEVGVDAFTTFREILTRHKPMVCQYLIVNFDMFFTRYHQQLTASENYVTKRQSIKLLGELLLDRQNSPVMTQYISKDEYLRKCMDALKDERKMIKYEAFHVFKIFVANPDKSKDVFEILQRTRKQLLLFLPNFLQDRTDDDQFTDEKSYILKIIHAIPPKGGKGEDGLGQVSSVRVGVGA